MYSISFELFLQCLVPPISIYDRMTSRRQLLQGLHIFTNEQDCSYNTPQLENEAPSCSVVLKAKKNYNPCPANTQRFPLYHGEPSSS
uniref:Uncharacterized protein n=1 Tax=Salix viminalis TaxID=40686 RepID=A0A6N2NHU3_SALVM